VRFFDDKKARTLRKIKSETQERSLEKRLLVPKKLLILLESQCQQTEIETSLVLLPEKNLNITKTTVCFLKKKSTIETPLDKEAHKQKRIRVLKRINV